MYFVISVMIFFIVPQLGAFMLILGLLFLSLYVVLNELYYAYRRYKKELKRT